MTTQLFPETLPAQTASLVELFHQKKPSFLNEFYLSGGTALSLQLGHRESEDLDFFIQQSFQPEQLQHVLTQFGTLENTELAKGTLNTFIRGVKLQFLEYPYSLLEPVSDYRRLTPRCLYREKDHHPRRHRTPHSGHGHCPEHPGVRSGYI
mgnify:CR=1 FL=1